jgi:homoaconitate hydratase
LGVIVDDEEFYELAQEGKDVTIDLQSRSVSCDGKKFAFKLDRIEEQILSAGGLFKVYEKFGPSLFRRLQKLSIARGGNDSPLQDEDDANYEW